MHRRCWRVLSTDLDGKDEDGMDKGDIEPHLCFFELLSENGLMFSESRRKGSKSGRSAHPASDVGRSCVDEMDTDREEIETVEDQEEIYVDALAVRMTFVFNGDFSGIVFPEYVLDPRSSHPILV